ncbi:hypothetical protein E6P09_04170 [Haloferax mediterranei ATCC 33500]|uniref:Uncharacterized protein n=1 Tax=Haloferax mediterranei (strain ATCC 33500 / DSM 1411 / JCM 8866 / NBRC 14739 / NCIMB 2177 / R-4) TaxID=523841 RepID=I3R143_HALMT|nr:hypothetical protein [Haloferax mediterranei]AFK17953.1 hypothetical protein HFX_0212 [Haloferax mediterranei ATCC 33500]AHZ22625.1 hypothetical protein BM92_08195 [Haloferax mediterranei ATCC 33500]EMA02769.1 hypothetical protein C439_09310 [Haloferax mediterranei ATCC 33500]MDX5988046.1 hypothetical protein [Haloferax mediterranei ATCC 33500]QCQ74505.1 hypothetical protein E6P09_04170 [Haloferax mediterranei ATCC 33500]
MTTSAKDRPATLDLSREESWVVHAALLAAIERAVDADEEPTPAPSLLARVEAGDEDFNSAELDYLVGALRAYREQAPSRDQHHISHVIDHIEAAQA